jgi:hypothetical protein
VRTNENGVVDVDVVDVDVVDVDVEEVDVELVVDVVDVVDDEEDEEDDWLLDVAVEELLLDCVVETDELI